MFQANCSSSGQPNGDDDRIPKHHMTDENVIMELRRRSRHRGHQIVGYRRKLMQQVYMCVPKSGILHRNNIYIYIYIQ